MHHKAVKTQVIAISRIGLMVDSSIRMVLRLLIYASWLTAVLGCTYYKNRGLLLNGFQTTDPGLLVLTNRTIDTDVAYGGVGGVADIQFNAPIEMMRADALNYWIRVCDHGILHLADTKANLQNCIAQASVRGIGATNSQPIIIADSLNETLASINFTAEVYHVLGAEQLDKDGNVIGPSFCDLEIIEGLINDCEEEHRFNQTVQEFAVVTWNTPFNTKNEYLFQAVVAVTTENRTYVVFLYSDTVNEMGINGVAKGLVHAANAGLSGSVIRFVQICEGTSEENIHEKSNCRCAQRGHYVFETTETTPGIHGFCGSEPGRVYCSIQPSPDFGTNVNRNCRPARNPEGTCDASSYCLAGTNGELIIKFKNYNADRVSFVNYTQFTQNAGNTGYDAPYGDNVHVIDSGTGSCTSTVTPSNGSFESITVAVPSSADCFEIDSATNQINFVLLFWNSADGVRVTTANTKFLTGSCDLDDLPSIKNATFKAGNISSTTVLPGTSAQLSLTFYDRLPQDGAQPLSSETSIQLGRMIFPEVCYTPKSPYIAEVTAYGIYVFSCHFSNNPDFINNGDNQTIDAIQPNGCLPSSSELGEAGRFVDSFKRDAKTLDQTKPFCLFSGGFPAFSWNNGIGSIFIHMRCTVDFCRNTQLYMYSKCKDSCANTIIDANVTDADDARRRKRQIDDVSRQIVTGVIEVIDPSQTDQEKLTIDKSRCVDPTVAKGVIGGLVSLLIISTVLTVVLYFKLKSTKVE